MNGDNSSTSVIQAKDSSTASDGIAPGGATFDAAAFRRAIEERDTATLLALYADDAELVVVDRDAQPSRPRVLTGVGEIGAYLDGRKVRGAAGLDLRGGRIARQSGVQAWDE